MPSVGQELLNVPMGEMIRSMATAIADAQWDLDKSSVFVAEMMSGEYRERDAETGDIKEGGQTVDSRVYFGHEWDRDGKRGNAQRLSMMELGFTPTFYQFVDTIIEVKISITMTYSREQTTTTETKTTSSNTGAVRYGWGRGGFWASREGPTSVVSTVNAAYSNKYSYSIEGSSLLRTKLVPVPPPAILEERIRHEMDMEAGVDRGNTPPPK